MTLLKPNTYASETLTLALSHIPLYPTLRIDLKEKTYGTIITQDSMLRTLLSRISILSQQSHPGKLSSMISTMEQPRTF